MILVTSTIGDFDQFLKTFSTKGAAKRKQHGSKGSRIFRDPKDNDRVSVLFDWDEKGWENFLADPESQAIFKEAGLKEKPQMAIFSGKYDS
jgi:heme-degrading monooxygenase HmoA